jgi:hypothetical protein
MSFQKSKSRKVHSADARTTTNLKVRRHAFAECYINNGKRWNNMHSAKGTPLGTNFGTMTIQLLVN